MQQDKIFPWTMSLMGTIMVTSMIRVMAQLPSWKHIIPEPNPTVTLTLTLTPTMIHIEPRSVGNPTLALL